MTSAVLNATAGVALTLISVGPISCARAAAGLPPVDRHTGGVEAEFHIARDDYELGSGATAVQTRTTHVGIALFEAVHHNLTLGLSGGVVSSSQTGQALTSGMNLSGQYLRLALRATPVAGRRWRTGLGMGVLYQRVKDAVPEQRVELDWVEGEVTAVLALKVADALWLYAGSAYNDIQADQKARGVVNSTLEFGERDRSSTIGGVDLEVDPGGHVTLAARRGGRDGFTLQFWRVF